MNSCLALADLDLTQNIVHSRCLKRHLVSTMIMDTTPWYASDGDNLINNSLDSFDEQVNRMDGMFLSLF